MNEEKNIIHYKKYGNRRVYDTNLKRYVTLNDISAAIRGGNTVVITDNENNQDITSQVLTQIFLQEYQNLFSAELLHQLIKLPQYYIKEYFEGFLKSGMQTYVDFTTEFIEQYNHWIKFGLPINDKKTEEVFFEFTKQFFKNFLSNQS